MSVINLNEIFLILCLANKKHFGMSSSPSVEVTRQTGMLPSWSLSRY